MVFSPGNTILFFRRKIKDDLSQNVLGNMIFSVYLVKVVFLFPTKVLPFCRKSKDDHLPKNTLVIFLVSLKNMIFILENMAFLLIEKLKIIKKFTFMKKFRWFSVLYGDLYRCFHILLPNENKESHWLYVSATKLSWYYSSNIECKMSNSFSKILICYLIQSYILKKIYLLSLR